MDYLRKIAQGCRNHYEKIILTLVLLGLAAAVYYLDSESKAEKQKIEDFKKTVETRGKSVIKMIDLSEYDLAMKMAANPPALNFSLPHNLFNPVKWQRAANNELVKVEKGTEVGWPQMAVTRISPLNFSISLFKAPSPGGAFFNLTREAEEKPANRRTRQLFMTPNTTNRFFDKSIVMRELKGVPENPEAVIELLETSEKLTISSNRPYAKIEGYEADLKYKLNESTFNNLRIGSTIRFLGDTYNIVVISASEVVASGQNEKKYSVKK